MSQINPFTGAIIQSTFVQQRQGDDKERQIRRVQNLGKNAALQGDRLEHQVESSDALQPIHDQETPFQSNRRSRKHPQSPQPQKQDGQDHVDLTA